MNLLFRILLAPVKMVYFLFCLYLLLLCFVLVAGPFFLICERELGEKIIKKLELITRSADFFMKVGCPYKEK